jgi:CheY-like chemotaxis protein
MQTTQGHILYCEDHDDTRILMTLMLEKAGFQVTTAESGAECLMLAKKGQHFNLYLLDFTYSDLSGVAVCEAIRKFDAQTPVLFYSGHAMPAEREEAMNAGAQEYLVKPEDLFNLVECVARWIKPRHEENS